MRNTRITRTAGDYELHGETTGMLTLVRNRTVIAAVIRYGKRNGRWHDADAPNCADAVILPGWPPLLLALTAGDPDAANAILALPGGEGWAPAWTPFLTPNRISRLREMPSTRVTPADVAERRWVR